MPAGSDPCWAHTGVSRCGRWCVSCREVLKHEELEGKIKAACLGSLLQQQQLEQLEDQYLAHTQVRLHQQLLSGCL